MKGLIKRLLREALEEARSIEGQFSKEENIGELLTHIQEKYSFDNTYISFRDSEHVGKINPNNKYNTPTGLYVYKLSDYVKEPTYDLSGFRAKFPFASDKKYMQFLILKDNANIIDSEWSSDKLDVYVKNIQQKYGKIDPVNGLCERWLKRDYESYYGQAKNDGHKFWLFLFDVVPYIYPNGKKNNSFAILSREMGIDGFSDDKCEGWIHPNEKCQAVFFKSNIFKDQFILEPKNTDMLANKDGYTDEQIIKMLSRHRLNPIENIDKIIPHLGNEKISNYLNRLISNLDSNGIRYLLNSSNEPEKVINILLSNERLISNLNSDDIEYLLNSSKEKEKVINMLGEKGKNYISNLNSDDIEYLLRYSKEPEKVMNILGEKGKNYISNLDSNGIKYLIGYSKEPEKVINILSEKGKEYISNLNSDDIEYLLNSSKEKEKVINMLGEKGKNYISNLPSNGIKYLLRHSTEPEKVMNVLGEKGNIFISNLNSDDIEYLLSYSKEPEKIRDLLKKYGHKI